MKVVAGDTGRSVTGLAYDSRAVEPGFLFFAIRGFHADGNQFAGAALERGAAAVVSELPPLFQGATWVQVAADREAMAGLAANFHGRPSREIEVVGVTGTNGKTTTAFLLDSILRASGAKTAMLGTVERRIDAEAHATEQTTPEAPDTQAFLRRSASAGCRYATLEVSSHALELRRCDALQFRAAIFTNLTRDHLDFHGTFDSYYSAKQRLFIESTFGAPVCVINRDDPFGARLWREISHRKIGYGLAPFNDIRPEGLRSDLNGISFRLAGRGEIPVESPLFGLFNVYNILGACAAALELGLSHDQICRGVAELRSVPGRMERVPNSRGVQVFVDFAHTDDALRNTLKVARTLTPGRLIVLFGCGGDRDRTKRPEMGRVAAENADTVVLTSDNPRTEDPDAILGEIEPPLKASCTPYVKISDRREAIRYAISLAGPGDTVLLAGKGHESCQIVGAAKIRFSDREEALRALEQTA